MSNDIKLLKLRTNYVPSSLKGLFTYLTSMSALGCLATAILLA